MFDKRLFHLVPETRLYIAVAVLLKWVALGAYIVLFFVLGSFLADLAQGLLVQADLLPMGGIAALLIVLRCVADAGARLAGSKAAALGKAAVRQETYEKLVRLGSAYQEQVSTAQAIQICGEGAEQLEGYFGRYLPQLFYAVLAPLTLFVVTCTVSVPTAIVLLVCVPLVPVSIVIIMKIAKRAMGAYWDSYVDLGGAFLEAIRGLTTLKVYRADERKQQEMNKQAEEFRKATMKLLTMQLNSVTIMDFFTFGGAAVGIIIVLVNYASGSMSLGAAFAVVFLAIEFFMPMRILGSYFHTAMGAATVIDQIFDLLDAEEPFAGTQEVDPCFTDIVLSDLGYAYASSSALSHISATIETDSFVGITGESGSGKSTLAKVLTGVCRTYTGSATIGGIEVRDIAPDSLHATVTCISSNEHVFKGTFRSNLMLGNPEASDYAMWNALGSCHLDDFVLEAGGLDAPIAEGGANLSGGQRQRLCVARAVLRDTPIYIFDEATSNIDAESEREILTFIQKLAFAKTVIVISHRLTALMWADDIMVLSQGRIAEEGPHAYLVAQGGPYAQLWSQQEHLEALAHEVEQMRAQNEKADGEARLDVPQAMAEAMEKMPTAIATAAMSVMKGMRIRALAEGGSAGMPAGHPSNIPLGATINDNDTSTNASADLAADDVATSDATIIETDRADESAESQGADAVSTQSSESAQLSRSVWSVMTGLIRLSKSLVPMLLRSTLLGCAGFVAALGITWAAVQGLLGSGVSQGALGITAAACIVGICGLIRGFLHYGERLTTHDETFRTLALVRDRVFGHMRTLAPAKLEARDTGDLISLLTADIELLEVFYAQTLSPAAIAMVLSLAVVLFVAAGSFELAVLALVWYVIIGVVLPAVLAKATLKPGREVRARAVRLESFILESLEGLPELLAFGCADMRAEELGGRMGALAGGERRLTRRSAFGGAVADVMACVAGVVFAIAAAALSLQGSLDGGIAVLCAAVVLVSFEPVVTVAHLGTTLHQTLASGARVLDFLDEDPQTPEIEQGTVLSAFTGANFEDVSFSYGEDAVLSNISLDIERGSIIHVAGKSGAGKSTLLKLLMRFWDVQEGCVSVSEVPVCNATTASLRSLEGYMTQDTQVFAGSVRDNMAFVCPDATDEQIYAALEKAALRDFVEKLPQGIDTPLDHENGGLSDGERQRLGLARMFLYDPPFLLLDEPTSNLDSLNEAAVLQAVQNARADKTILIVSHRPSGAALADVTCLVDQGRLS